MAFGAKTTEEIKDLLGMVDVRLVSQFVDCLGKKRSAQAIDFLNKTLEKGKDPQELAKTLINYLRQGLIQKIAPDLTNPIMTGLTQE